MQIKLEWLCYRTVEKLWQCVKPFTSDIGTLRTDGQTDRQTDGRTDRQTELLYQYRVSVCWRAIKMLDVYQGILLTNHRFRVMGLMLNSRTSPRSVYICSSKLNICNAQQYYTTSLLSAVSKSILNCKSFLVNLLNCYSRLMNETAVELLSVRYLFYFFGKR